ncbi:hypothetical protein H4R26_004543, partial [Coemansia thaxteri]
MAHIHTAAAAACARHMARYSQQSSQFHASTAARTLLGKVRQALADARPAKKPAEKLVNAASRSERATPPSGTQADRRPSATKSAGSKRAVRTKVPDDLPVHDFQPAGPEVAMPKVFGAIEQPDNAEIAKFVLIGAANAGKSTLVNRLTGVHVSIVSDRPQTTRSRVMAAATVGHRQLVFLDTPGVVSRHALRRVERTVVTSPWLVLGEADVAILLLDAYKLTHKTDAVEQYLFAQLAKNSTTPAILVVNKIDLVEDQEKLGEKVRELAAMYPHIIAGPVFISALGNVNVDELKDALLARTAPGRWMMPAHTSCDMSDLMRAEELIRAQWFARLTGYLPYVVRQRNAGWEEVSEPQAPKQLIIKQELVVSSPGEAKILLGTGGSLIKDIGRDAANNIAEALRIPTRLHLQVL